MEGGLGEFGWAAFGPLLGGLAGNGRVKERVFSRRGADKTLILGGNAARAPGAASMAARLGIRGCACGPSAGGFFFREISIRIERQGPTRDIMFMLPMMGIGRLITEDVGLCHSTDRA